MSKKIDDSGKSQKEVIAITIMRKASFVSKDPVEFKV
jgi:hypothetical protein